MPDETNYDAAVSELVETYGDGSYASRNPELERAVLGSVLLAPQAFAVVSQELKEDDLTDQRHRMLLSRMGEMREEGLALSRDGLLAYLQRRRDRFAPDYIDQIIADANAQRVDTESACRMLRACTSSRRLLGLAENIKNRIGRGESPAGITAEVERALREVQPLRQDEAGFFGIDETISGLSQGLNEFMNPYIVDAGVQSPWPDVNDMIHGFHKGELFLLAARPSVGKSLWAGQVAAYAASQFSKKIVYFSHEMQKQALFRRMCCQQAGVSPKAVREGDPLARELFTEQMIALSNSCIKIDDSRGKTVPDLEKRLKAFISLYGPPDLTVIDYLQLMQGHKRHSNKNEELGDIANGLKSLSKEMNVAVLVISALSRASEGRPDKEPTLADMYMSGMIEYAADQAALLHRPAMYAKPGDAKIDPNDPTCFVISPKQREGEIGRKKLRFNKTCVRFENWDSDLVAD